MMKRRGGGWSCVLACFAGGLALLLVLFADLAGTARASLHGAPVKHASASVGAVDTEEVAPLDQSRLASLIVTRLPRSLRLHPVGSQSIATRHPQEPSVPFRQSKIPPPSDDGADPH